jgi:hypothetical protein
MRTKSMMYLAVCLSLLLAWTGMTKAQETKRTNPAPGKVTFDFEADTPGQAPAGFTSYASGGGPAGKWVVQEMAGAPSGKKVVVQTDADTTDYRFPILIADQGEYADLEVSVKGQAISGKEDRAIGLVFRFRDPQNYCVCRANALEDNLNLYKLVGGRRQQIAGAKVKVPSDKWHTVQVVAQGDHIVCSFNDQKLIDVRDATYKQGKVGLWTKADSVTAFDDLTVSRPQP